ncbi:hypothetical protein DAPPUDRAFT_106162 [Daphnia pulex]|uniref:Uncharacterized protein n=1 Tax=Daphnia pulex TaxID=6669 RepID=E9GT84_DAPPU|nr:hypothetical protein DAPPUDRAFT_106162 [Daphnia pulex]|eukprot:EFX77403.1 hypothetical protein DAPPUDRAFT_106162 [Daphnia pulex]
MDVSVLPGQSPRLGLTVDEVQRQAGAQLSPELPPPNLEGFEITPGRKTLSEWIKEEFAKYNVEMIAISGRLNATDTRVVQAVTRLDDHRDQLGVFNQELQKIRQKVVGLRSSITEDTNARIAAVEANIATTMLAQRTATETLQTRMVAHIERAVGQLQDSLNELRRTGLTEFDDTELRADLRHLVEAQGEEITNGLARSLGQHSDGVIRAIVELKVRMSRMDNRLRSIYRSQQAAAQGPQPERTRQGAQGHQTEVGRTRQQQSASRSLWEEDSEEEASEESELLIRRPSASMASGQRPTPGPAPAPAPAPEPAPAPAPAGPAPPHPAAGRPYVPPQAPDDVKRELTLELEQIREELITAYAQYGRARSDEARQHERIAFMSTYKYYITAVDNLMPMLTAAEKTELRLQNRIVEAEILGIAPAQAPMPAQTTKYGYPHRNSRESNPKYTATEKSQMLEQALEGEAAKATASFTFTAETYNTILRVRADRFGDPNQAIGEREAKLREAARRPAGDIRFTYGKGGTELPTRHDN